MLLSDSIAASMNFIPSMTSLKFGKYTSSDFKTIIAITHKPSMLKYFDEIYVFNEGTIESHGTYEDLKSTNKFLSEMINVSQIGAD